MRSDLNKQLCERERAGHRKRYKEVRNRRKFKAVDEEASNLSSREGMSWRHVRAGDTKSFNENLNPLWGAVRKAVGRPWDAFYSDLCKTFDKRSVINQHILQHLEQFVERNIYEKDGQLVVRGFYGGQDRLLRESYVEYYVDPRDGILKKNKHYRSYKAEIRARQAEREAEEAKVFRQLDAKNVLRKINDVWFHFELRPLPKGKVVYRKPDNQEFFQNSWSKKMLTWDKLQDHEKRRWGIRSFEGSSAHDEFTGANVYFDTVLKRPMYRSYDLKMNSYEKAPDYYHAAKKTASRKLLKKAGIVE